MVEAPSLRLFDSLWVHQGVPSPTADWISTRQDADKRVAAPSGAVRPPDTRVLGYCTLSATVLTLTDLPNDLARKLPRYPQFPVTLQAQPSRMFVPMRLVA